MHSADMTKGNILKTIILFSIPLLISNLMQQMYNTVDLLYAGNLLGTNASAAVGTSANIAYCVTSFFSGLSTGTSIITSQAVGSGNDKNIHDAIHTAITFSLLLGVIVMLSGIFSASFLVNIMHVPEEIREDSIRYLQIYFFSGIPIVVYNLVSGLIRALGDSMTPMKIQLAGGISNIIMDGVFLLIRPEIESVAWATLISQTIPAILCIRWLARQESPCKLIFKELTIQKELILRMLQVGVPAGVQVLAISLSNNIIQFFINGFGINTISAFASYFKVELFIYNPIIAIGQAVTTFTGQNEGAHHTDRIRKGMVITIVGGMIITVTLSALLLISGKIIFGWFNPDQNVIQIAMKIAMITFPFYWIYAIMEVSADVMRGMGESFSPMIISLFSTCILRVILLYAFVPKWNDCSAVAAVYPITWTVSAILILIRYAVYQRKEKHP